MTLTKTYIALGLFIVLTAALLIAFQAQIVGGESFTGTISQMDSATTTTVGPDGVNGGVAVTIFSKNTDCDARVITTPGTSAIMISFGEKLDSPVSFSSSTISASVGHLQAASTTVVYDSGQFGCGTWSAFAWSSTTLSLSEF